MTTIVADQRLGYLAADRQSTSNDGDVACECLKIRKVTLHDGVHLLASSGHEGPATIFETWYESGDWDEPPESMESLEGDDEFTTVILNARSEIWLVDKFMQPYRCYSRRYATGSGGPFAWAVLEADCEIGKAMEVALRMDPHSGFGFDVMYLDGRVECGES